MRKLSSILLLTCLALTLSGYHFVFYLQRAALKSEMRAFLQGQKTHKDVVEFSFNKNTIKELEWEGDDEFCFEGEMYDVIQKKENGNSTTILCIADKKETALLNEYQKTHKRNNSHSVISQLISMQFEVPDDCCLLPPQKMIEKKFTDHCCFLQNLASAVVVPPPDVC